MNHTQFNISYFDKTVEMSAFYFLTLISRESESGLY